MMCSEYYNLFLWNGAELRIVISSSAASASHIHVICLLLRLLLLFLLLTIRRPLLRGPSSPHFHLNLRHRVTPEIEIGILVVATPVVGLDRREQVIRNIGHTAVTVRGEGMIR